MRTGYAIRDYHRHGWLMTRAHVEGADSPVTVWGQEEEEALTFRKLGDARQMLKVIRRDHRKPARVHIVDPRYRRVI